MEEEALADSPPLSTTLLPRPNPTKQVNTPSASSAQEKLSPARKILPSLMKHRRRNILWFLAGNISAILLIALIGGLFLQAHSDDLHYGSPRTFQIDVVVGHGRQYSSSQPLYCRQPQSSSYRVELPAGNPAGAESYIVPYYILGPGSDQAPVTLEFRDVTGDGKPDMIIHIHLQAQEQTFVFVNDGTRFRPPTSNDHIHL